MDTGCRLEDLLRDRWWETVKGTHALSHIYDDIYEEALKSCWPNIFFLGRVTYCNLRNNVPSVIYLVWFIFFLRYINSLCVIYSWNLISLFMSDLNHCYNNLFAPSLYHVCIYIYAYMHIFIYICVWVHIVLVYTDNNYEYVSAYILE